MVTHRWSLICVNLRNLRIVLVVSIGTGARMTIPRERLRRSREMIDQIPSIRQNKGPVAARAKRIVAVASFLANP